MTGSINMQILACRSTLVKTVVLVWASCLGSGQAECVGNDSRCFNAALTTCNELDAEGADCKWHSAEGTCKPWCASHQSDWESKCAWTQCKGCAKCLITTASSTATTITSTTVTSTTITSTTMTSTTTITFTTVTSTTTPTTTTTTTQSKHCIGNDSRCGDSTERQCRDLQNVGAHCRWESVQPETSGVCLGNDSRCTGSVKDWCQTLAMQGANCEWKASGENLQVSEMAPLHGKCANWCGRHKSNWSAKCSWKNCDGCSPCQNRRLRGIAQTLLGKHVERLVSDRILV